MKIIKVLLLTLSCINIIFGMEKDEPNIDQLRALYKRMHVKNASNNNAISSAASNDSKKYEKWLALGVDYYGGCNGVERNYPIAHEYFEKCSNQEVNILVKSKALSYLGIIYYAGLGRPIDNVKAVNYFLKSLENCNNKETEVLCSDYLGHIYWVVTALQDFEKAKKYFENAINNKHISMPRGCVWFHLGQMYVQGQGVEEDPDKAKEYFDQSFNLKPADQAELALYNAEIYATGTKNMSPNYSEATKYYKQCVKQNENKFVRFKAMAYSANFYLLGVGVRKKWEKGLKYLREVADQEDYKDLQAIAKKTLQKYLA